MGAFIGVGDGEEVGFFPRLSDELGADREAALRETTRDADRGETGEVYADRINIAEVKSAFSPILNAGIGEVGVRSASTSRKA